MAGGERKPLISRSEIEEQGGSYKITWTCFCILVSVVFERIAFYSVTGNLVLFLNEKPLEWQSYNALFASFCFLGISFIMSFFGGLIADTLLGRFKTILVFFIIYIIGYCSLPFIADFKHVIQKNHAGKNVSNLALSGVCESNDQNSSTFYALLTNTSTHSQPNPFEERCAWLIYLGLFTIAVGTGAVKANIAPFGADQVRNIGPQTTLKFFNWFYWCINIGACIGLALIAFIQQRYTFLYGYIASIAALVFATLIFIAGSGIYTRRPPAGSVLTNIYRIMREALRVRRQKRTRSNSDYDRVDQTGRLQPKPKLLDFAKFRYGGSYHDSAVEDVRTLGRILLFFLTMIPYWVVYFQMQTTFLLQGLHMKLNVWNYNMTNRTHSNEPPQIVAAWLSLFDIVFLIMLIPFVDKVVYPKLKKAGYPFGMSKRISLGMFFAILSMVVAGLVERWRLKAFWPHPHQLCKNESVLQVIGMTTYSAADMSIFWQIPQYALIGISEVFASIGGLELAYLLAPKSMKAIIMGIFYLFSGIGSVLGTVLIYAFRNIWFFGEDYGNINCRVDCSTKNTTTVHNIHKACHLDYYFYVLAGVEAVGLCLFVLVARVYRLDLIQQKQKVSTLNNFPETRGSQTPESHTERRGLLAPRANRNIQRQKSLPSDGDTSS